MPCCGGKDAGKPIKRSRYYFGLLMLVSSHTFIFAWLALLAVFVPRYRRIVAGYWNYSRQTLRSVLARERIVFEGEEVSEPCTLP
jgi:hypothetical protein